MADMLSQDEINALVEACRSSGADDGASAADRQVRLYDFARPDKFCKEHLRALNQIHAKHGASLAVSLASMFRVDTQVSLLSLDQLTYREFCGAVPDGTLFAEVALEPLTSIAIFEFNPSFVGVCVDLLAGGSTCALSATAKITEIDKAVVRPVVELALRKYTDAWASSMAFKPEIMCITTETSTRQMLLPSEGVLVCGYEVTIADQTSMMSICTPSANIEAVLPTLALGRALNSPSQKLDRVNEALKKQFDDVNVECRAVLGRASLSLGEVADLEVGDLIRLPVRTDSQVELWVENVAAFAGSLGRSGQSVAIRVSKPLGHSDSLPIRELPFAA